MVRRDLGRVMKQATSVVLLSLENLFEHSHWQGDLAFLLQKAKE
jgi:hypothetical protein